MAASQFSAALPFPGTAFGASGTGGVPIGETGEIMCRAEQARLILLLDAA